MNILLLSDTVLPLFYGIAAAELREIASAAASKKVTARAANRQSCTADQLRLAVQGWKIHG
jgi:hypothetical protein